MGAHIAGYACAGKVGVYVGVVTRSVPESDPEKTSKLHLFDKILLTVVLGGCGLVLAAVLLTLIVVAIWGASQP